MSRANTRRIAKAEVQQRRQRLRRKITLAAGGVMALTISLSALLLLNQAFRISVWEIEVTGSGPGNLKRQIDTAMKALPDYGFWSTRPSVLRARLLQAVADLEEIHIRRTLTGSLYLHAIARIPVGLWQKEDGEIFLVDIHGVAYRPLQASEMADLPMLRVGERDIREVCELLRFMKSEQPAYFSHISELFANNNSWKINFNRGQQWMISRNRDIPYSISRISDLLEKPRWRSGHWRVDARAETRWFVRPARQEGVI